LWADRERAQEPLVIFRKSSGQTIGVILNEAEAATIVAALMLWQISEPEDWLHDIASRNGAIAPLDNEEITDLAKRILPEWPR
jgi:hypothetical protein